MNLVRFFKAAAIAAISSFAVACSNENISVETPQEENYVTVNLKCAGDILDVEHAPMSKVHEFDLYQVQVYSVERELIDGIYHSSEVPYAYGKFDSTLDGVTIKLIEGKEYKFEVAIVLAARWEQPMEQPSDFVYTTSRETPYMDVEYDSYYGELEGYVASPEGEVTIYTKRVVYALECIAEDLNEGMLEVSVINHGGTRFYGFTLSPDHLVHERVYSFSDYKMAWAGLEGGVNYRTSKFIDVKWTRDNGEVVSLGAYEVTFERNIRTVVRIKVEELQKACGIVIVKEDVPIEYDDNVYYIQGGTITEIPVQTPEGMQ